MSGDRHRVPTEAGIGAVEPDGVSRGDVLLKGALAAGALYGLGAVAPFVRRALAAEEGGDVEVLNYLLPFEYLQLTLYNRVASEKNSRDQPMPLQAGQKELIDLLATQEDEHVKAIKSLIKEMGGEPVGEGKYALAFRVFEQALRVAETLETTAVGAYNGAISRLESEEARDLVYSIVQTEARHAARTRIGIKENPAYYTFDHCVPEDNSLLHVVQFTGVYPEYDLPPDLEGDSDEGS